MSKLKKILVLFYSMLYISAFTFGGGFVIVSFMKKRLVDELKWIEEDEMLDFISLSQVSPGAIAVNAAVLVGWKVAGLLGMVVAVLGTILPPMFIICVVSYLYESLISNQMVTILLMGMQAGVAAVILDVVARLGATASKERPLLAIVLMMLTFVMVFFLHISIVYVLIFFIILSVIFIIAEHKLGRKKIE